MAAIIERATGVAPYFVGKPNARMIREALDVLEANPKGSVMIGGPHGDRHYGWRRRWLDTILVLSGVDGIEDCDRFPFRPSRVVGSVAELVDDL